MKMEQQGLRASEQLTISSIELQSVHRALGIEIKEGVISVPEKAPKVIDFSNFWKLIPAEITFPKDREHLLGFDYVPQEGRIVLTESTRGSRSHVRQKKAHLVDLHTEPEMTLEEIAENPPRLKPVSEQEKFLRNIPPAVFPDVRDLLLNQKSYVSVVIRLGKDLSAILMMIKTQASKPSAAMNLFIHDFFRMPSFRIWAELLAKQDSFVTEKCGVAIYRGFATIPPEQKIWLRLRT